MDCVETLNSVLPPLVVRQLACHNDLPNCTKNGVFFGSLTRGTQHHRERLLADDVSLLQLGQLGRISEYIISLLESHLSTTLAILPQDGA